MRCTVRKKRKGRNAVASLWRVDCALCLAECIAAIRRRFEVHAWASSTPSIRYSRRRSRRGKQPLPLLPTPSHHFLSHVFFRRSKRAKREREREPPIFSYRILVCVHARRAINGKILESRSRNPDAGSPVFMGRFYDYPHRAVLPSPLASLYLQSLPLLLHVFIPLSFSRPTLPGRFIN